MQEKRIQADEQEPAMPCRTADDDTDDLVIAMLLLEDGPGVWAVEDIGRELGSQGDAADAVSRLASSGLLHRGDGFVFASRAAVKFQRILR